MIDIIIPAYNAQKLINKLLGSIYCQLNLQDIDVTIVNDGDGDYSENIKSFPDMSIKEISYGENNGCGFARQYGVDHTNNPYIIFCDADDILFDCRSVINMASPLINNEEIVCNYTDFYTMENGVIGSSEGKNIEIWLHGKCFRRSFIEENNIKFFCNSAGEDAGFNKQVILLSKENQIARTNQATYVWTDWNRENRINTVFFGMFSSKRGLIENLIYAYINAMNNGVSPEKLSKEMLSDFIDMYLHYELYLAYRDKLELTDKDFSDFIEWVKPLYNTNKNALDIEDLQHVILQKRSTLYNGIMYFGEQISFNDFVKLLEN